MELVFVRVTSTGIYCRPARRFGLRAPGDGDNQFRGTPSDETLWAWLPLRAPAEQPLRMARHG